MLDKMEEVQIDEFDLSSIQFKFPMAKPSGKVVVDAKEIDKSYGDRQVLKELDFSVIKGDRVAFVGRNGEGKTTLSKIITGNLDYAGECRLGHNVSLGYFAQNQDEILDPNLTVFDTIDNVATGDARAKIRTILGGFLFGEDDIDKKVKVLSGGEKTRLSLAKLLLQPVNFLVLDEPTNHLDMRSKDILKNALLMFEGTLIVVSHDRDFLQGLTTKVFEFKNKKIKEYIGDIYDFLEMRKLSNLQELEAKEAMNERKTSTESPSQNKKLYEQKKELERTIRKTSGKLDKIESEIEKLENRLAELDKALSEPESSHTENSNINPYEEYGQVKEEITGRMKEWEDLHLTLEDLEREKDKLI
jgi:ATP-binding cassette subfamily F protein 3